MSVIGGARKNTIGSFNIGNKDGFAKYNLVSFFNYKSHAGPRELFFLLQSFRWVYSHDADIVVLGKIQGQFEEFRNIPDNLKIIEGR